MLRTEKRMRICITLLIMNLAFIWGNSLLPGEVSGAVSDWVKDALHDLLPSSGSASAGGFLLRKLAHFTEFTALGACLGWLFAMLRRKAAAPLLLGACGGLYR